MKKHSDSQRKSTKLTKANRKNRSKDNCSFGNNYTKSEKTNVDNIKPISTESGEVTVNRTTTTEDKQILTSTLLKALRTLNGENGIKNNEILKKLLDANETQNGYSGLLAGKPKDRITNTVGDDEGSEDDEELVEYVFNPRRYFIYSACELCKNELKNQVLSCKKCNMTHYCAKDHMEQDDNHVELCVALQQIKSSRGEHVYANVAKLSPEDYRVYRVMTMTKCEEILGRPLQHFEKEIVIYPRICYHCREWRNDYLLDCCFCGQVYCKNIPENAQLSHKQNCQKFALLRKLIIRQEKMGNVQPCLPQKILEVAPSCTSTMRDILKKLGAEVEDEECSYAALTQVASAPLTVWYGLKLAQTLERVKLRIHLIGAEMQFEGDLMQKWELILHLAPAIKTLDVTFVGPELVPPNISMQPKIKSKVCSNCHQNKRVINLYFVDSMYHDYCASSTYSAPDLICFLNPGLHRTTGFNNIDSWPATIQAASKQKKPVIITSYTAFESPLDLHRFLKESDRPVNIILPPMPNPFTSYRPERNFISDEKTPLMFKNFYSFMVE